MTDITKAQLLTLIKSAITDGIVSKQDIINAVGIDYNLTKIDSHDNKSDSIHTHKISAIDLLQYIGGFIVLLGIGTFVATFWNNMTPIMRIIVVVGSVFVSYILGVILLKTDKETKSGIAFQLIAGALFPFGFYVVLNELYLIDITTGLVASMSLFLLLVYAGSYYIFKHPIFTFFMLVYSISFVYSSIYALIPDISIELISYVNLAIGVVGMYIGYSFKDTENAPLSGIMYLCSSAAVLVSPGFMFNSTPVWVLIYPFLLSGMFYLTVHLHSKAILTTGVLALMSYVVYLTAEYFSDVVGWPIALIVAGVALIAIGYGVIKFKNKV